MSFASQICSPACAVRSWKCTPAPRPCRPGAAPARAVAAESVKTRQPRRLMRELSRGGVVSPGRGFKGGLREVVISTLLSSCPRLVDGHPQWGATRRRHTGRDLDCGDADDAARGGPELGKNEQRNMRGVDGSVAGRPRADTSSPPRKAMLTRRKRMAVPEQRRSLLQRAHAPRQASPRTTHGGAWSY